MDLDKMGQNRQRMDNTFHTRKLYFPAVTNVKSSVFENKQQKAVSFAAGEPQIASPVSTFHKTNLLSSSPPNVAMYLLLGLNEMA